MIRIRALLPTLLGTWLASCAPLAPAAATGADAGTPAVLVMMCVCRPPAPGTTQRRCSCRPPTEVPVLPDGSAPGLAVPSQPASLRVLPGPDWAPESAQ